MASDDQGRHDDISFRYAQREDVTGVVALLADDILGAAREGKGGNDEDIYLKAFDEMQAQGGNHYLLAVDAQDQILGCIQITLIPGLSRSGMKRAQIEGVRVAKSARGLGLGSSLMQEAHTIARKNDCGLVQLTTDRARDDALRFYESMGYENSHHGLKLLF